MSTLMIDGTHGAVNNIPVATPKVAGYTTGTPGIQWTAADWAMFPDSGHVRIEQGFGVFDALDCDVYDVEALAVTASQAAQGVKLRIEHNAPPVDIYASDGKLAEVIAAFDAIAFGKPDWYHGHVGLWLADWNLDRAEADMRLGKVIRTLPCHAVQWASPSSNPRTLVPGSSGQLTLKEANLDLSVTVDGWHAHGHKTAKLRGLLVRVPVKAGADLTGTLVTSGDGGKTWHE